MDELFFILKLYRSRNIGPKNFYYLIDKFSSAENACNNIEEIASKWNKKVKLSEDSQIEKEIELNIKKNIEFLKYTDPLFPKWIKSQVAPIFSYMGNKEILNNKMISVVGTRNPSLNGIKFTEKLCNHFNTAGIITVSGMAKGIDRTVHMNSKKTIGVMAGGVDVVYPTENRDCYEYIKEFGLLISDQITGTTPNSALFPHRNSIIAALGKHTVVIESTENSGALITAKKAIEFKRKVYAVPGHPFDERYKGNNFLLKNNCNILLEPKDIEEEMDFYEEEYTCKSFSTEESQKILELISFSPTNINDLISISGLQTGVCLSILIEMEIVGIIKIINNNYVIKISN